MATTLQYNFVACNEENDVLTVGFADHQFETKEYLLLQNWSVEMEDEDDEIYIERDDQSQGTYGGIERFTLARDHARLLLGSKTAEVLHTEQEVYISFSATDEQFQQLKTGLTIIFAGREGLEL
jgi:hypothetical protein